MDSISTFLELYGLMAIFALMLVKSAGAPIPIPADAVMLAASARVVEGKFVLWQAFVAIWIALIVGGVIQFWLAKGPGRGILYRYGRYLGLTPARLDKATQRLRSGNAVSIGVAILTPGVRSVAVVACGLASIPIPRFVPGLALGTGLFLALHFFLGYVGGSVLGRLGEIIPLPLVLAGVVVLLLVGLGVWVMIRRRQMPQASSREVLAEAVGAWHEATCPVCLALGAADRLQIHLDIEHHHG